MAKICRSENPAARSASISVWSVLLGSEATLRAQRAMTCSLPISRQAIQKHLAVLDEAGLVTRSSIGREVNYSADPAALSDMTDWAVDAQWQKRLERLRRSLDYPSSFSAARPAGLMPV